MGVVTRSILLSVSLLSLSLVPVSYTRAVCTDADDDGYFYESGCGTPRDCNDAAPARFPGATEVCNGFDDNCDQQLDEGCDTECGYPFHEGEDILVDVPPQSDEAPGLVWNGSGYAVAWNQYASDYVRTIRLARLDSGGAVLGETQVSDSTGIYYFGDLVWTGTEYGVAWNEGEVRFARVDASGVRTGPEVQVSDSDPASSKYAALAWSGHEYGVAWVDGRGGSNQIYFARLDAGGVKISQDVRISSVGAVPYTSGGAIPGLTWSGTEWAVSWADSRDGNTEIYVARLDESGSKVGPDIRLTNDVATSASPSIVWNGAEYGIAWYDGRSGMQLLYFTRMDAAGNKVGGDVRVPDSFAGRASYTFLRSVMNWTGSEWTFAWIDNRSPGGDEIFSARLDAQGTKLTYDALLTPDPSGYGPPALAWNGRNFGLAWADIPSNPNSIYFGRVACCDETVDADGDGWSECGDCDEADPLLHPGAEETCDFSDNDCDRLVDETFDLDGDGFTTCGGDCQDLDPDITGGWEIACDGVDQGCDGSLDEVPDSDADGWDACGPQDALNPDGLDRDCNDRNPGARPGAGEVCFNAVDDDCDAFMDEGCSTYCTTPQRAGPEVQVTQGGILSPSLIFMGREFGLFWRASSAGVYFQRLTLGADLDGSTVELVPPTDTPGPPLATWTGREFGVSWDAGGYWRTVRAAPFDRDGSPAGAEREVGGPFTSVSPSAIAWTGREYGVVWTHNGIKFALLDDQLRKIGQEIALTAPPAIAGGATLDWTGTEFGVAWEQRETIEGYNDIYFLRVGRDGQPIGTPSQVTFDPASSGAASLAWTGTEHGLVWSDSRFGNTSNIYFTRISSDGTKIGTDIRETSFVFPTSADSPSLAWTGSEYGLAWSDSRDRLDTEIFLARLSSAGAKIGTDLRITDAEGSSFSPSLVWTGADYGLAWGDARDGDSEVYFSRVLCCGEDRDSDGFGACDDCVDTQGGVHPGAQEICDGLDNNCDGTVDEGFALPPAVTSLGIDADKYTLRWDPASAADRYDVVRGSLEALRSSYGDFTAALTGCLHNDAPDTFATDAVDPSPHSGVYYIVRAQAACRSGTYDSGAASQSGSRDSETDASAMACP